MLQPSNLQTDSEQRHLLETTIERLISLLDFLDGDPDTEANGDDEPSLGWAEHESRYGVYLVVPGVDLEEQCEDEGAEHDGREPDWDDEVQSWPNPMGENLVGGRLR